ncbi:unnamed protein product [Paramecium pentaurelia]|uniref:FHA domain-containing protein n=1 Tax=Paramecium pentaurelia TaxID=43138 RepID=A0A8S1V8W4_9CILI|nr:unnamed protein product [Paramecium pentaurelia]
MDYDDLYKVLPKDPKKWKLDDVTIWLKFIGLQDLDVNFRQNAVDGALLSTLDDNDLKEMGIVESTLKIKKLVQWIQIGFKEYSEFLKSLDKDQGFDYQKQSFNQQQEDNGTSNSLVVSNQYKRSSIKAAIFEDQVQSNQSFKQTVEEVNDVHEIIKTTYSQQECNTYLININNGNQRIPIKKEGVSIGRNPDNQLVLKEDYVSRQHCKIFHKENNGFFYLQDLGSSSGTFVQLTNPTLLKEGLVLHMGSGQFLISKIKIQGTKCSVFIKVLEGIMENNNLDFELTQDQTALIFGRQMSMFADDTHLSGQHAQFTYIEEGLVIEDLDSRNGTWLRLSPPHKQSEPIKLIDGRRFRLAFEQFFQFHNN